PGGGAASVKRSRITNSRRGRLAAGFGTDDCAHASPRDPRPQGTAKTSGTNRRPVGGLDRRSGSIGSHHGRPIVVAIAAQHPKFDPPWRQAPPDQRGSG